MRITEATKNKILREIRFVNTDPNNFGILIGEYFVRLSACAKSEQKNHEELIRHLGQQIDSLKGKKAGSGFKDILIQDIGYHLAVAKIPANTPVGLTLVEAALGPMQQLVLNAFHTSGQIRQPNLEKKVKRALNIPKVASEVVTTIQFKERPTFEEAYAFCGNIEEVTVERVLVSSEILNIAEDDNPQWREIASKVYGKGPFQGSNYFLRLNFDPKVLYYHGISTIHIANSIEKGVQNIACLPSPQWVGAVDVFPDEVSLSQSNGEYQAFGGQLGEISAGRTLIDSIIIPAIKKIFLSGIKGIENATTEHYKTMIFIDDLKDGRIAINADLAESYDVDIDFIKSEITNTGVELIEVSPNIFKASIPVMTSEIADELDKAAFEAFFSKKKMQALDIYYNSPDANVQSATIDETLAKAWLSDAIFVSRKLSRDLITPFRSIFSYVTKRLEDSKWYYVLAIGTNMAELYKRNEVDPYKTYNDNVREMYSLLGLGAAKAIHFREIWMLISAGAFIAPIHVDLLTDAQFVTGAPRGVSDPQPGSGPLAEASSNKPLERLRVVAFGGNYAESTLSASTAIATGARVQIGTGPVGAESSEELRQKYEVKQPEFIRARGDKPTSAQNKASTNQQLKSILDGEEDEDLYEDAEKDEEA